MSRFATYSSHIDFPLIMELFDKIRVTSSQHPIFQHSKGRPRTSNDASLAFSTDKTSYIHFEDGNDTLLEIWTTADLAEIGYSSCLCMISCWTVFLASRSSRFRSNRSSNRLRNLTCLQVSTAFDSTSHFLCKDFRQLNGTRKTRFKDAVYVIIEQDFGLD